MTAVLRRGVWIVVLVAVLFAALGAAYVVRGEGKGVTSQAQLVVTGRAASTSQDNAFSSSQYVNQRMSTYAEVATSDIVLQPAAASLGIAESDLAGAVTATVPLQTTVIALAVTGADPVQAQQRAQAVLTSLSDQVTALETQTGAPTRVDVRVLSSASLPAGSGLPSVPLAAVGGFAVGILLALAGLLATHLLRPRRDGRPPAPVAPRGTPEPRTGREQLAPREEERPPAERPGSQSPAHDDPSGPVGSTARRTTKAPAKSTSTTRTTSRAKGRG